MTHHRDHHHRDEETGSARATFVRIRDRFRDLGMLGQTVSVEHGGSTFRITCDERAFMVYRVVDPGNTRHHVPGWPVCLIDGDVVFEECGTPGLSDDHYACGLNADCWLQLIEQAIPGGDVS